MSAADMSPPKTPTLSSAVADRRMTAKQLLDRSNAGAKQRVDTTTKEGALRAFLLTLAHRGSATSPIEALTEGARKTAAADPAAVDREYARFKAWAAATHPDYVRPATPEAPGFEDLPLVEVAPTVAAALAEMTRDQLEHGANAGTPQKARTHEERLLLTIARRGRKHGHALELVGSEYVYAPAQAVLRAADPEAVAKETALLEGWLERRHPEYIDGNEHPAKRQLQFDSPPAVREVCEVREASEVREVRAEPASEELARPAPAAGRANPELLKALAKFYSQPGRKQKTAIQIATLATKYAGREEELYAKLEKQYPGDSARPGGLAAAATTTATDGVGPGPIEAAVAAEEAKASVAEWNAEVAYKKAVADAERAAARVKQSEAELTKARKAAAVVKAASAAAAVALRERRRAEAARLAESTAKARRPACFKWIEAAVAITVLCASVAVSYGVGLAEVNALMGRDDSP